MKYICTKTSDGVEEIFIFTKAIDHDCMARGLADISDGELRVPISAGFVYKSGTCYGESMTLGLRSREEVDTEILVKQYQ